MNALKRKAVIDKSEQAKLQKACKKPNHGPNFTPALTRTEITKDDIAEQNTKVGPTEAIKVATPTQEVNVVDKATNSSKSNPSRRESEVSEIFYYIIQRILVIVTV